VPVHIGRIKNRADCFTLLIKLAERQSGRFPCAQRESGGCIASFNLHWEGCMQGHDRAILRFRDEDDRAVATLRRVAAACIVKPWGTAHFKRNAPLDDAKHAEDMMRVGRLVSAFDDRHEVSDFGDSRFG